MAAWRSITAETRASDREANMWAFARAALSLLEEVLATERPRVTRA